MITCLVLLLRFLIPAGAPAAPRSGLEREVERLKSALHLSITTVQQHIASADPYSPAALLADPASTLGTAAAAPGGLSSARGSASDRGSSGDGDGNSNSFGGTLRRLNGNDGNGGEDDGPPAAGRAASTVGPGAVGADGTGTATAAANTVS